MSFILETREWHDFEMWREDLYFAAKCKKVIWHDMVPNMWRLIITYIYYEIFNIYLKYQYVSGLIFL